MTMITDFSSLSESLLMKLLLTLRTALGLYKAIIVAPIGSNNNHI